MNLLSTANAGTTSSMGKHKATPERSTIVRAQMPAFSRRERKGGPDEPDHAEARGSDATKLEREPLEIATVTEGPPLGLIERRPAQDTLGMPIVSDYGRPPQMPKSSAPPPLVLGAVENPAHLPGPREIPAGSPDDPASAPGTVPPGDSRSFRRGDEFALVYRVGTCVISRTGRVGTRGQWRVVDFPTSAAAGTWYAKECSRFVSEGFSDYRE